MLMFIVADDHLELTDVYVGRTKKHSTWKVASVFTLWWECVHAITLILRNLTCCDQRDTSEETFQYRLIHSRAQQPGSMHSKGGHGPVGTLQPSCVG